MKASSSYKTNSHFSITFSISLIYIMNNKAPNMKSCGTPKSSYPILDSTSFNFVICRRLVRYVRTHFNYLSLMPEHERFLSKLPLSIVSKALLKSNKKCQNFCDQELSKNIAVLLEALCNKIQSS